MNTSFPFETAPEMLWCLEQGGGKSAGFSLSVGDPLRGTHGHIANHPTLSLKKKKVSDRSHRFPQHRCRSPVWTSFFFVEHLWWREGNRSVEKAHGPVKTEPKSSLHMEIMFSTPGQPDLYPWGSLAGCPSSTMDRGQVVRSWLPNRNSNYWFCS